MPDAAHSAKDFAMVPVRAFADRRLKARHLRVLGALCKSYDRATGCALVSQAKIAERANLSRQLVNKTLPDLVDWGYLTRIKRGRRQGGQFKTHVYGVLWQERHVNNGVYTDHVTPGGNATVSTPGFTSSYPSRSKLDSSSQTYTRRGVARSAQPGGFAGDDAPLDAAKADKQAREFEADAALARQLEIDVAELRKLLALHGRATDGWSPNRRVALDLEIRRETEGMQPAQALAHRRRRYQKLVAAAREA